MAAVAVSLVAACSNGGTPQAADSGSPSPTTSPSTSPSPSVAATGIDPAVSAAYSAVTASLAALAKDVPAMTNAADFRTDLQTMNAALARARNGVSAERDARYPRPDCTRVRADAAVVHAAAGEALAARSRISSRAAAVAAASRQVDADRSLLQSKSTALAAALKATGTVLPPTLNVPNVAAVLAGAHSAQGQVAATTAQAQSAAATGGSDAGSLNAKASSLASVC